MKRRIFTAGAIIALLGILVIIMCPLIYNLHQSPQVVVLSYHHFLDEVNRNKYEKDNEYVVSKENFEKQLKFLKEKGYESMTSDELECWINKKCEFSSKKVLITIDDGNISSYYIALPLLEKYGYNSINFVIASRVGEKSNEWKTDKYYFLGEDLIKDIRENHTSMEIGSHSYNLHNTIDGESPLNVLSEKELYDDTKKSKEILDADVYCYPFGMYNEKLLSSLKESGFKMAFTFKPSDFVSRDGDIYQISRVEVRGSYDIKRFEEIVTNKKSLLTFWKDAVKKILNR